MQASNKRLDQQTPERGEEAKRTTIILEKEERDFIDQLIREGKEPGIKPLISKMLEIYKSMMIYDWRFPGEYYCGISRIAYVNVELLNILIQQIPREKWRDIGKKMGDALKVSMETTLRCRCRQTGKLGSSLQKIKSARLRRFYPKRQVPATQNTLH